jgi:Mn2+/Fe2+ NRAMP family transporter
MLFGLLFGLIGVKPIPAIILAQALNGVILPLVALFLWLAVNDRALMTGKFLCGPAANILLGISVSLTCLLGITGILRAFCAATGMPVPAEKWLLSVAGVLVLLLAGPTVRYIRKQRHALA